MNSPQSTSIEIKLSHGHKVAADLTLPTATQPIAVVVFLHGYKGFKDWGCWHLVAERFAESRLGFLKFNFTGNGTTADAPTDFADLDAFARNTYSNELDEACAVIESVYRGELAKHGLEGGLPIHILGHSRGGGIAILAAARTKVISKVATWASVADFGKRFPSGEALEQWKKNGVMYVSNARTGQQLPHHFSWYLDYQSNVDRLNIRAAARKLTQPLLVVHAADDEAVEVGEGRLLFGAAERASLVVLHEGGHTFGAMHPWQADQLPESLQEATDQTASFFSE